MPGRGSNYEEWLQALYDEPECDAVRLGKHIFNATHIMYAEESSSFDNKFLAFSVIDPSRLEVLTEAFEAYMKKAEEMIRQQSRSIIWN